MSNQKQHCSCPNGSYGQNHTKACFEARISELLASRDEWRDRYNREVLGLNNEGDPIGGDPPRGLKHAVEDLRAQVLSLQSWQESILIEANAGAMPSMEDESELGFERRMNRFLTLHNQHLAAKLVIAQSCEVDARRYRAMRELSWLEYKSDKPEMATDDRRVLWDKHFDEVADEDVAAAYPLADLVTPAPLPGEPHEG